MTSSERISSDLGSVEQRLASVLPASILLRLFRVEPGRDSELGPREREAMATAGELRLQEFSSGRAAARAALGSLGIDCRDLPIGEHRAPLWPRGVRGTISHSRTLGAVMLSLDPDVRGLGVDVEARTPLEEALFRRVLVPRERASIESLPRADRGIAAKLRFSAKESVFKAWWPQTGLFLDFADVEIHDVEPAREGRPGTFLARIGGREPCHTWLGHHLEWEGSLLTFLVDRVPPLDLPAALG